MKKQKTICLILFFGFMATIYLNLVGYKFGIVGLTKKNGNTIGCYCHSFNPGNNVSAIIRGPSTVHINDTVSYTLRIFGGPAIAAGCDISANRGTLNTSPLDTSLRRSGNEITHRYPKLFTIDTLQFTFKYTAPSIPGADTLFANGNSVNNDNSPGLDIWNYANNFSINIIDIPLPVELSLFTSIVTNNNVHLKWTTAIEENNSGFDIELSNAKGHTAASQGVSTEWIKIGYVPGSGTTTTPNNYSFINRGLNSGKYNYRLKQIDFNGNFQYYELSNEVEIGLPSDFLLLQNYPNPFNPVTKIDYTLPADGNVSLSIYDAVGREVAKLVNDNHKAGYYTISFDASQFASGVYYYRLSLNGEKKFNDTKKMLLVK